MITNAFFTLLKPKASCHAGSEVDYEPFCTALLYLLTNDSDQINLEGHSYFFQTQFPAACDSYHTAQAAATA